MAEKPVIRIKEDPEHVALELAKKDWVKHATATSNAMDLEPGVFGFTDPKKIAESLKRSVEKSKRLKNTPFASAISMVTFFENRMGKNLSPERRKVLQQAKEELRKLFGKEATTK